MAAGRMLRRLKGASASLALAVGVLAVGGFGSGLAAQEQAISWSIAAQPLSGALVQFAGQSGLQVFVDDRLTQGLQAPGVDGALTVEAALDRLLSGSGLTYQIGVGGVVSISPALQPTSVLDAGTDLVLGPVTVIGAAGVTARWDGSAESVYRTPGSVSAVTTEQLETFRAGTPSDLLRDIPGVLSAEARTGGGIDPNIRGLQGDRVAVTVDGAANSTTLYRGYQGMSNRSYVDADFIAGVAVEAGPGATAGAIGGTVAMRTYGVDDLVAPGEVMGVRLHFGLQGNASEALTGPGSTLLAPEWRQNWGRYFEDPDGQSGIGGGAGSVMIGLRGERVDLVLGFARRANGNYHAGTDGDGIGALISCPTDPAICAEYPEDTRYRELGLTSYLPGEEVYNTSQDNRSTLLKLDWRIAPGHVLSYGYNGYDSTYGNINPSGMAENTAIFRQESFSTLDLDSQTLTYRFTPGNDLIDLTARYWQTDMGNVTKGSAGDAHTIGNQWGVEIANRSSLTLGGRSLDLAYGLTYAFEDTRPDLEFYEPYMQRWGQRETASIYLNGAWQANDWLSVSGGLRHHLYRAEDQRPSDDQYSVVMGYLRPVEPVLRDAATDLSLAVSADVTDSLQLFATYDSAARMPSLFESLGGLFVMPSADLESERAETLEIGANYSRQGLFADTDRLDLKLSFFDQQIDNYIGRQNTPRCVLWNAQGTCTRTTGQATILNLDAMNSRGAELQLSYEFENLSLGLNATRFTDIEFCRVGAECVNSSLAIDYATNQIPPEYTVGLNVGYRLLDDRLGLNARVTRVGARAIEAEATGSGGSAILAPVIWEPYTTLDLHAEYRLTPGMSVYVSAENVLDSYHVEPLSLALVPAPGRTLRFGLTAAIGGPDGGATGAGLAATSTDWSGYYLGLARSGSALSGQMTEIVSSGAVGGPPEGTDLIASVGGAFDIQGGWNRQLRNGLVLGFAGDFTPGGVESSRDSGGLTSTTTISDMLTLSMRAGVTSGNLMVYGAIGVSSANVASDAHWVRRHSNPLRAADSRFDGSARDIGMMLGGGAEYALNDNWSVFSEYRHITFADAGTWSGEGLVSGAQTPSSIGWSNDIALDQVRIGVNYRF